MSPCYSENELNLERISYVEAMEMIRNNITSYGAGNGPCKFAVSYLPCPFG